MPHSATDEVERKAKTAVDLIAKGDLDAAHQILREANSIDSENPAVLAAWNKLNDNDNPALELCERFIETEDEKDADEILDYFTAHPTTSPASIGKAMTILLRYSGDIDSIDHVTGQLLTSVEAQKVLAQALKKDPTVTFNKIFERGDDSTNAQTSILLDNRPWDSEADRIAAERDVFQLLLAQLMKAGLDFPERAMKSLSKLLASENKNLKGLIDADGFEVILDNLDGRLPNKLRSQATLACVKLLELSPKTAKELISQYVVQHIEKPTGDRLIQAFSAAAAVFPMAPEAAAELFLTAGFLPNFVKIVTKWKHQRVDQAALELLSAACMDTKCRTAILRYCPEWLDQVVKEPVRPNNIRRLSQVTTANLVLEKIKDVKLEGEKSSPDDAIEDVSAQEDRLSGFKAIIIDANKDENTTSKALEGLAYSSVKPWVKEKLGNDQVFLKSLLAIMDNKTFVTSALFGGLSVLSNITTYRPVLSEEQQKLSELKAYANTSKPLPPDPLDNDEKVTIRCANVLRAGLIPLINKHIKLLSAATLLLSVQIINSLAQEKSRRGPLAQQGAIRFLLYAYNQSVSAQTEATPLAAHALARILISVNPNHAFGSTPITSCIRPLASLLSDTPSPGLSASAPSTSQLTIFESLLALTNLASVSEDVCEAITRLTWPALQDHLLSSTILIQRASAELVCNLSGSPSGAAKFSGEDANGNLRILLGLADVEDVATRRAAAGALAMLTEWPVVVRAMLKLSGNKAVERLVEIMQDEEAEVVIRGAVALRNVVGCEDHDLSRNAVKALKSVKDVQKRMEDVFRQGDGSVKEEISGIAAIIGASK